MSRPTAADLIERLRDVYGERDGVQLSDEKLSGKLPIALSTFNRWKKADTDAFEAIVEMLDEAGWLNTGADARGEAEPPADPLERIAAGIEELLLDQKKILRSVQPAPPKSQGRVVPKSSGAKKSAGR